MHAERNYEYIVIRGARENNLKNVSLRIPKHKITVFTGVSGSGKSSLVFDTIAAEAKRQLYETLPAFVRNRLPKYAAPDAEAIEHLAAAVVVDQKRLGGSSRSTVGTATDTLPLLRLLFSRAGRPHVGASSAFSFNDPSGMCPACEGVGKAAEMDESKFFDRTKSLNEGAIRFPTFAVGTWYWNTFANSGLFDLDKKLESYSEEEWRLLLHGKDRKIVYQTPGGPIVGKYEGVKDKFHRLFVKKDAEAMSESTRDKVMAFLRFGPCPDCGGTRLNRAALDCRIDGRNIAEMCAMEIGELIEALRAIDDPIARPLTRALIERLGHLVDIGLHYLSLDRETATLSGGESQRIKMVRHLGSSLTDLIYIFDEPSVGMHPRDVHRLNRLLIRLRDKGNTVLVVEHDRDVVAIADVVVDIGPYAGERGGNVVFQGTYAELLQSDTLTGKCLREETPVKTDCRVPRGRMPIARTNAHNLKNVSVAVPSGVLTVVTGVAGSGKSTLIRRAFLTQYPHAVVIDQSPVGASVRSNPATYTGAMDDIRKIFAKANGVSPSLFSFNSKGACPNCHGIGALYIEMAFMDPVRMPCEHCGGRRFRTDVLAYAYRGASISDVLEMTVREASEFFETKEVRRKLQTLREVGLDYLKLGQPLGTLSGGECQRIKLAAELHKEGNVYVMDEPTTGLHVSDVKPLLALIDRLVDRGNTVVVIEHNPDVIKRADWIIDLGPEGGRDGGSVVFEGTPSELLACDASITGRYLRRDVGSVRRP